MVVVPMAMASPAAAPAVKDPTSRWWVIGVLVPVLVAFLLGPGAAWVGHRPKAEHAPAKKHHPHGKRERSRLPVARDSLP